MVAHQLDGFFYDHVGGDGDQFVLGSHEARDLELSQEIVELVNTQGRRVGRGGFTDVPVGHDTHQMAALVHHRQMTDSLVPDEGTGLIERRIRVMVIRFFCIFSLM